LQQTPYCLRWSQVWKDMEPPKNGLKLLAISNKLTANSELLQAASEEAAKSSVEPSTALQCQGERKKNLVSRALVDFFRVSFQIGTESGSLQRYG